jgi:hypothetical protein
LAASCAAVVLSLFGGTASASSLCTKAPTEPSEGIGYLLCAEGTQLRDGKLSGTSKEGFKIETASGNIECTSSSFEANFAQEKEGSGMLGEVTKNLVEKCTSSLTLCKGAATVESKAPWAMEIVYDKTTSPESRLVLVHPLTVVKLPCATTCEFSSADIVEGDMSNKAQIATFSKEPITGPGGGICPKTAQRTVIYGFKLVSGVLTAGLKAAGAGEAFTAEAGRGQMCLEEQVQNKCPVGKVYAGEALGAIPGAQEAEIVNRSGSGAIKCAEAPSSATYSEGGIGSVKTYEFKTCTSSIKEIKAEVRMNPPFDDSVLGYYDEGFGAAFVGRSTNQPELELETTGGKGCAYRLHEAPWAWYWFGPTYFQFTQWDKLGGPAQCPATIEELTFPNISTPAAAPIYIAAR